jgi:hypothetical protein
MKEFEMNSFNFTNEDIEQIKALGITEEQIISQIATFKKAAPYVYLKRPCTIGDGIQTIQEDEIQELIRYQKEAAYAGRFIKFIPASGAASRMFKTLLRFHHKKTQIDQNEIAKKAEKEDGEYGEIIKFMDGIRQFAFFNDLKSIMKKNGLEINALVDQRQFREILDYLLFSKGLNYSNLPKGLLKFHNYSEGSRTAFEEHLVEAANYICDKEGICRLHFTVSKEHKELFKKHIDEIKTLYGQKYKVHYQVDFSIQKTSTDTIAVDIFNNPFRLQDGRLLFRPGGHGALLENLNDLDGDIIFIKNIDNVVHDRLKEHTFTWKKVLAGYLIKIQEKIFSYLERLSKGSSDKEFLAEAMEFARVELKVLPPKIKIVKSTKERIDFLFSIFNRPIRVCGVVKNVKEPGGGPFWVRGKDGTLSLQIVETAQIDPESKEQQDILDSSTHFNPVDIVCGIRDFKNKPFKLKNHVDPEAVFISRKSKDGRDLKALELPGLWNGSMAFWNTIFVEVPLITFNPVKTVNDLLRKEHQSVI